jgi:hypothetical protein
VVADGIEREATMTQKRRHHEREIKRQVGTERARLIATARGVAVDPTALVPYNSYSQPDFVKRGYYVDKPFVCQDCGLSQTWTAAQQKWWYEVAKGVVFSTATHCRACRQRRRAPGGQAQHRGGDPNRYRDPAQLLDTIRTEIEPQLLSAGYRPAGRNRRGARRALFFDYSRSEDLFTLSWDQHQARLAAERLTAEQGDVEVVATAELSGAQSTSDIEARLAPFMAAVQGFLDRLREPARGREPGQGPFAPDGPRDG